MNIVQQQFDMALGAMHGAQQAIHGAQQAIEDSSAFQSTKHLAENAFDAGKDYTKQGADWAGKNPLQASCAVAGAAGIGMIVAPMVVASPVIGAIGLSPAGPVAGGLFAGFQSTVGVTAGSIAATVQSAAMGGSGVAAVSGVIQGAGTLVSGTAAGFAFWKQSAKEENEKGETENESKEKKDEDDEQQLYKEHL